MALSINPLTHVIYVPKADLTLLQASPEIRQIDVDQFRKDLKSWEGSEEGIVQLKTHVHNTQTLLSGVTYSRIVSILAPYTVEFEDGQYTVDCTGANHNLGDVKVVNQVSLIINNSAGLQTVIQGSGVTEQDKTDIVTGVWNASTVELTGSNTFGEKVSNGLLTFVKWFALKKN